MMGENNNKKNRLRVSIANHPNIYECFVDAIKAMWWFRQWRRTKQSMRFFPSLVALIFLINLFALMFRLSMLLLHNLYTQIIIP